MAESKDPLREGRDKALREKEWHEKKLEPAKSEHGVRKQTFLTPSDIPLPDLYTSKDPSDPSARGEEEFPGSYPFTRGIQPTMYRGRLWTMRQYAGFGSAAETNKRFRYLLESGTTGLSVAFDLPTQMGRDSDESLVKGEVGRVGVAIDTIEDMERLFDQLPLERVSTSMTINATAHILLALYLGVATRRGIPWTKLRGTVQNDILKEYIARGTYIYPPKPALKIVSDIFEFCKDHVPLWNTISISGYHIREAGSTAVQEVAFTLANGISYVESALQRGLQVDAFAPRLAFFFNCHNNFIEEIAKFRAARRMWAKIMRERFGAQDDRSCMLRFHTQTAGSTLTAQQPLVNVVRTTIQAMAAVLGGTQSLHTNSYDEALCLPTEEAALLALRTQQVVAHESGIADVVDALGGSYAVEALTDEIETRAAAVIAQIDAFGGMVPAIEAGYPQRAIEDAAYQYQREIEQRSRVIVGVNEFVESDPQPVETLKVDPAIEREQQERLSAFKSARDGDQVKTLLQVIDSAAAEERNLLPSVVDGVLGGVTLGEISQVLRNRYGTYRP